MYEMILFIIGIKSIKYLGIINKGCVRFLYRKLLIIIKKY